MKKYIISLMLCLMAVSKMWGTAQVGEKIWIDGKWYRMASCPLEYGTERLDSIFEKQYPTETDCSALWRNYIGYWSIHEGKLYLDSIHSGWREEDEPAHSMVIARDAKMFKKYDDGKGIWAQWVTGKLRIISGECVKYVHMGFESKFENEKFLTVTAGKVDLSRVEENKRLIKGLTRMEYNSRVSSFEESLREQFVYLKGWFSISFTFQYCAFQPDGQPTDVDIKWHRLIEGADRYADDIEKVKAEIKAFLLQNTIVSVTSYNGQISAPKYTMTIGFNRKKKS